MRRCLAFAEVVDAIGTREYALGELPNPEYLLVPYLHAFTTVIGIRGRSFRASR